MFKGRERVAAVVTRWSTTPHIRAQSVMEHSGFVVLYTDFIVTLLKWSEERRYEALRWAVRHDLPETVTGDMPGPVKRVVTDPNRLSEVEQSIFAELGEGYEYRVVSESVVKVVKAANLIDELFYLQNEMNLGNRYVSHVMANSWARLNRVLKDLCLTTLADRVKLELGRMADEIVSLKTEEDPHG